MLRRVGTLHLSPNPRKVVLGLSKCARVLEGQADTAGGLVEQAGRTLEFRSGGAE